MPMKKDGTDKRSVDVEVLVPGTPEQVWQVVATGPGLAAWFVKGEIEPRVGGVFGLDFGQGAITTGEVTLWEPPNKFGYLEREWAPNAPLVATEITITGRSGNRCVVRIVHSLFTSSEDWDDQVEGFESGWPGFFAILRVYLEHFAGASAASFITMTPVSGDSLSAWLRLCEALGLTGANVGERRTDSSGPESWSGVVEHVHQDAQQRWVLLRLDTPSPGSALVGVSDAPNSGAAGTTVSLCRYFYGDDADALAAEGDARWRDRLSKIFDTQDVTGASSAPR
jgi:uncharacterized protein YndB with AHSA1/START domain